jgi:ComEC/Rec2-related protein
VVALLFVWVSIVSGILSFWSDGFSWLWLLLFGLSGRMRWSLAGFGFGALYALISFDQKWDEIQELSYRPSFFFARCGDFKRAVLISPSSLTTEMRLSQVCPAGEGFWGFGRIVPRNDFSWSLKPSDQSFRLGDERWSLYRWRERISEGLSNQWPIQSGLRRAFLIGDGSELSGSLWKTMNGLGLSHLLVASGMHITLSAEIVRRILGFIFRWIFKPSRMALWLHRGALFGLITLYSALLGFDVSVARAWWIWVLTQMVSCFAPLGLRLRGSGALALAGIVLALADPLAIFDVSYALSFVTSWFILQTGSVVLTSLAAVFTCSLLGLPTTLLSVVVNGLLAGPLFGALIPLSFLPMVHSGLAAVCEQIISNTFGFLRFLSVNLPEARVSPTVSAGLLAVIAFICLWWAAKPSNFKVYFDKPGLVSLTLSILSRLKGSYFRERKRL